MTDLPKNDSQSENLARNEGALAKMEDLSIDDNPYNAGTLLARCWEYGYIHG